jgi:hypothetical protein
LLVVVGVLEVEQEQVVVTTSPSRGLQVKVVCWLRQLLAQVVYSSQHLVPAMYAPLPGQKESTLPLKIKLSLPVT